MQNTQQVICNYDSKGQYSFDLHTYYQKLFHKIHLSQKHETNLFFLEDNYFTLKYLHSDQQFQIRVDGKQISTTIDMNSVEDSKNFINNIDDLSLIVVLPYNILFVSKKYTEKFNQFRSFFISTFTGYYKNDQYNEDLYVYQKDRGHRVYSDQQIQLYHEARQKIGEFNQQLRAELDQQKSTNQSLKDVFTNQNNVINQLIIENNTMKQYIKNVDEANKIQSKQMKDLAKQLQDQAQSIRDQQKINQDQAQLILDQSQLIQDLRKKFDSGN